MLQILHPTNAWTGRNIPKIESQSEYNNPKLWTAKHVLLSSDGGRYLRITSLIFCVPKVLIEEPAHTSNFIII
jgi:hypothetical protein